MEFSIYRNSFDNSRHQMICSVVKSDVVGDCNTLCTKKYTVHIHSMGFVTEYTVCHGNEKGNYFQTVSWSYIIGLYWLNSVLILLQGVMDGFKGKMIYSNNKKQQSSGLNFFETQKVH